MLVNRKFYPFLRLCAPGAQKRARFAGKFWKFVKKFLRLFPQRLTENDSGGKGVIFDTNAQVRPNYRERSMLDTRRLLVERGANRKKLDAKRYPLNADKGRT
jgi:hypothetical protein